MAYENALFVTWNAICVSLLLHTQTQPGDLHGSSVSAVHDVAAAGPCDATLLVALRVLRCSRRSPSL